MLSRHRLILHRNEQGTIQNLKIPFYVYQLFIMVHRKKQQPSYRVIAFAKKDFVSLDENTLVAEAARIMYERDVCSVIVTRNDTNNLIRKSVGIITARDILHRVVAQSKGPFKLTLKDIMSTPLITINTDAPTNGAILLMKSKNITRLPVINEAGEILGVVSLKAILGRISHENIDDAIKA
jgi:CBS domain-containing protein